MTEETYDVLLKNCKVVNRYSDLGGFGDYVRLRHDLLDHNFNVSAKTAIYPQHEVTVNIPEPVWVAGDVVTWPSYEEGGDTNMAVRSKNDTWIDPLDSLDLSWSDKTISDAWKSGKLTHVVKGAEL
jgi:hypothetical protein